jgi:hypothetical protein
MDKVKAFFKSEIFLSALLLTFVSALAYLPFILRFGYLNDDWYEMFSVGALGPSAFHGIFAIDRPGRAFLMIPLYWLFGGNPLPWNISAYLFRLFGGFSVLWMLRMIWPKHKWSAMLASLLFLIYPGFLSQPNAIDYQSHIAGLFFAVFSIALSLKAIVTRDLKVRILLSIISIFFGIAYLSQMEYYAGFEIVRFVFLFILAGQSETNLLRRLRKTVFWYLPFIIVPLVFFIWRLFFFQSIRKATDVGAQLGMLIASPKHTLAVWLTGLIQSTVDVVLLAWAVPLYNTFSDVLSTSTPLQMLGGVGVALATIFLVWFSMRLVSRDDDSPQSGWNVESVILGMVIVVGALIPIVIADRGVSFPDYSRYTLVSLIGAAMVLAAVIEKVTDRRFQFGIVFTLVGIAMLTHFANGLSAAQSTDALRSFWWQASWRIPQMEAGTTLVVNYQNVQASEDYISWGPANIIYYPQSRNANYPQPALYSVLLSSETLSKAVMRTRQEYQNRRSIVTYANYRHLLVLSQSTPNSCLHVLNSNQPEFSSSEDERVQLLAPYSSIDQITLSEKFITPPSIVFETEPPHDWCYFYEKADYARQAGDLKTVLQLAGQADKLGLAPKDAIEWMPFLQAYAITGDTASLTKVAPSVVSDQYVAFQACRILSGLPNLNQTVKDTINTAYCVSPN